MKLRTMIEEIVAERDRQKGEEGFSPQHDDRYQKGELVRAAICFAAMSVGFPEVLIKLAEPKLDYAAVWINPWPWEANWDKRNQQSKNRCLVMAAALLLAEMERRDRAGATFF